MPITVKRGARISANGRETLQLVSQSHGSLFETAGLPKGWREKRPCRKTLTAYPAYRRVRFEDRRGGELWPC